MQRRQVLQAFATGAMLKVTGGLASMSHETATAAVLPPAAPTKTEAWLATLGSFDERPPAPVCIALGPEADAVIAALRVRAKTSWDAASHMTGWDSDCFRTGRDDPAGLEPWIETRLRPCDWIALVVDANDPATHARIPDWADRLAGLKEAAQPIAFIVGDNARGPWSSFRRLEVEALAGPARRHHCFSLRSRESPPAKASTSSCGQAVAGRNDDQGRHGFSIRQCDGWASFLSG
ncbi:hypothetical protein, partial [uncultured Lamprocystis sp.]|uniref:hypothetical protein n=1 Tax=uncultured Lamprocystis sp. TaxID=543132 RepID=UPI0025E7C498